MLGRKKKTLKTVVASKIETNMKFRVEEAYKTARTNLAFSILKEGCKKVVVTGALSREGKSTTSVNLAISLAQQINTKVLLIDCDLRKPRVNQFFDLDNTPGLTDYLSRAKTLEEVLKGTDVENLSVIVGGTLPPNPSELLASNNMKDFLTQMESEFDYIIMDTPPLNVVIDCLPLATISDGVVLSTMQGYSTHPEVSKTVETLQRVDAKILGFVLNAFRDENKKSNNNKYGYYKDK
jgi:capsular exopolysaccharide synthesis family protein